ncbi:VOC family protein [Cohnella abietis]|uniref:Catechol-2,3-dioxygenase n=1 Tax=Cohnella abietis TaxID=2507935 RepID=A0A3T1D0T4_9BACL|nr:VOC family protein [Cohnella abietis]BBI31671.1 catechol-2,3-dioxygenase [Cohnella abietis]
MSQSIHADTVLGQLKLKVSNLERSVQFYKEVVGFQILNLQEKSAELTVDGQNIFLILEEIPNAAIPPRRSVTGLYHFAILVPTREQLGLSLRTLAESGIHIGQGDHLVSEALYIEDPDHNGIEIYWDRPRSEWKTDSEGNIMMGTEPVDIKGLLQLAGDKPWTGLSAGTILGHLHLHVSELPPSKVFYCDILGFDMVFDASKMMGAYFISAGGYHHHIGMNIWAGIGAPQPLANATGLAYYTIVLPSQTELERTLGKIKDAEIPLAAQNDYWVVRDPSGIEIRLISAK